MEEKGMDLYGQAREFLQHIHEHLTLYVQMGMHWRPTFSNATFGIAVCSVSLLPPPSPPPFFTSFQITVIGKSLSRHL
jgi:hypothetical protein